MHLRRLEDAGKKQSANLQANSGLEGILSKHFFFVQSKKALNFKLFFIVTVNETVNNKTKTKEIFTSIFVKKWNLGLILLFLIHTLITEFKV